MVGTTQVKILFQVQGISAGQNTPRHQGVWASLRELVQRDGVRGLWRGNGLNCVRVVPSSAIQFGAYVRRADTSLMNRGDAAATTT